jgi:hypothetical protein
VGYSELSFSARDWLDCRYKLPFGLTCFTHDKLNLTLDFALLGSDDLAIRAWRQDDPKTHPTYRLLNDLKLADPLSEVHQMREILTVHGLAVLIREHV